MKNNKKIKALALCLVSGCLASCGPKGPEAPAELNKFFEEGEKISIETTKFKSAIEHGADFNYFLNDAAHGINEENQGIWLLQSDECSGKLGLVKFYRHYQSLTLNGEYGSTELTGSKVFRFTNPYFVTKKKVTELKPGYKEIKPEKEGGETIYQDKEGKVVKKEEAFHEVDKDTKVVIDDLIWSDEDDMDAVKNGVIFDFKVQLTPGKEAPHYEVKDLSVSQESPNKNVLQYLKEDIKILLNDVKDEAEKERITLAKKALNEQIELEKQSIIKEVGSLLEFQETFLEEKQQKPIWSLNTKVSESK